MRSARAVPSSHAPDDILTGNTRKAVVQEPRDLRRLDTTVEQRGIAAFLLEEYASAMPQSVTRARIEKVTRAGLDGITFGWIGGLERGDPHYYRVQGPTFLIESGLHAERCQPHSRRLPQLRG